MVNNLYYLILYIFVIMIPRSIYVMNDRKLIIYENEI